MRRRSGTLSDPLQHQSWLGLLHRDARPQRCTRLRGWDAIRTLATYACTHTIGLRMRQTFTLLVESGHGVCCQCDDAYRYAYRYRASYPVFREPNIEKRFRVHSNPYRTEYSSTQLKERKLYIFRYELKCTCSLNPIARRCTTQQSFSEEYMHVHAYWSVQFNLKAQRVFFAFDGN